MPTSYDIYTNPKKRRILVVKRPFAVDHDDELEYEDFDAMFVNVASPIMNMNKLTINLVSPLLSEKCRFKPCFVTQRLKDSLGDFSCVVDGYAVSPSDTSVTDAIERIYGDMSRMNFFFGTEPVVEHFEEMIRLCRFAISRKQSLFTDRPTPGVYSGYMELYHHTIWNPVEEADLALERNYFHEQMLRLGYIRKTRFVDKMHLCPYCNRSHLLFFEVCPKCGSSNIMQEDVIHHFRCAHVAPASSYERGEDLICPKCRRELKHIGVDYDRPTRVYTCKSTVIKDGEEVPCGEAFMYPSMRVKCAQCHAVMKTNQLREVDAIEYEFTERGEADFADYSVTRKLPRVGFFGHGKMEDFENYIRECTNTNLMVLHYHIYNPDEFNPDFFDGTERLRKAVSRLLTYKCALDGSEFYFLRREDDKKNKMEYEINAEFDAFATIAPGFAYKLVGTYRYCPPEDVEGFLRRMKN